MGPRVRPAALTLTIAALAAAGALGACAGPPEAQAARTPFEQLAADSAMGDSAALASLPPALSTWLDVRALLTPEARASFELAECQQLESPDPSITRRRLRLRLEPSEALVLYAVADADTGTLERVEFVRRRANQGQRGIVWERERDRTLSTWWRETPWGLSRRVERGEIPRGGPVPRAMRALGRQLLTMPCDGHAADSAEMTP
jgi:hypothetical protein